MAPELDGSNKKLFGTVVPEVDPETGEAVEATPPNDYEAEDVVGDANLLDAVGAGIGKAEMYKVMLAVRLLGEDPEIKVATVRFFGKFLTLGSDYYVFETTLKEPAAAEEEAAEGVVPSEVGSGTNGYTYFVCTTLGGAFTPLPNVTPAQVVASRTIRKYLSGDLGAEVSTFPTFPGKEAEYLRAVVARIAASTVLCPTGYFTLGEEGGSLEKAEDFAPAEEPEVASWCHRYPGIRRQGRCELFVKPPPEGEEEAPEEDPDQAIVDEGAEALLTTVDADAEIEGGAAWSLITSSCIPGVKYKIAAVRSNLWRGAVSVASGTSFTNIYVGNGFPATKFVIPPPPAVSPEFDLSTMAESTDLPPKPEPEAPAEEGEGEAAE